MAHATKTYEQKLNGRVAERLTINHQTGMATLVTFDDRGCIIGASTFGAADGRVRQFAQNAEPRR